MVETLGDLRRALEHWEDATPVRWELATLDWSELEVNCYGRVLAGKTSYTLAFGEVSE